MNSVRVTLKVISIRARLYSLGGGGGFKIFGRVIFHCSIGGQLEHAMNK